MRFGVYSKDAAFRAALYQAVQVWRAGVCADVEWAAWSDWPPCLREQTYTPCGVLFVDADDWNVPMKSAVGRPETGGALFLCSDSHRAAIESYAFHPDGFLQKQVTPALLDRALARRFSLWRDALEDLDVSVGRSKIRFPLCELIWAEAGGRSCVLHSSQGKITAGESLAELAEHLPGECFLRCQKSFLVNLRHVQSIKSRSFSMLDGAEIPIGRNNWAAVRKTYAAFRARWTGEPGG